MRERDASSVMRQARGAKGGALTDEASQVMQRARYASSTLKKWF